MDPRDRARGLRVLYVNDDVAITMLTERALHALGYEVEAHESAEQALEALRARPDDFAAVVTDMSMPGMSGLDLLRKVLASHARMPCILTSSMLGPADAEQASAIGAHPYSHEAFSFEELGTMLTRLLEGSTRAPSLPELDDALKEILPKYIAITRREIHELRQRPAGDLAPALALFAHRLKGSGGSYGFPALTALGAQLEQAAREARVDAALALLADADAFLGRAQALLDD